MRVARGPFGTVGTLDLTEPSASEDPVDPTQMQLLFDLEQRRRRAIRNSFRRFDCIAMGVALGLVLGVLGFLVTAVGILEEDVPMGRTIGTLRNFFPGYSVTWPGAGIGASYGFGLGFTLGATAAWFRNLGMRLVLKRALWQASRFRRLYLLDEV